MLLNPFSLTILFFALISLVIALCGGLAALRGLKNRHTLLDRKMHLLFLSASIFLTARLCSYPFFYVALQNLVKEIKGAMCIYGVTQVLPNLCIFLEIIKPIIFFFTGGWLILHYLTRQCKIESLFLKKLIFFLFISFLVIIDSAGDLLFFLKMNSDTTVRCCTLPLDSPHRLSATICKQLLGRHYEKPLFFIYYLSNFILAGGAWYVLLAKKSVTKQDRQKRSFTLIFILGLINFFITGLAIFEIIAPGMMHLPYHHCPYCLLQYVPDSFIILGLFMLGTFGLGWTFGIKIVTINEETSGKLTFSLNRLCLISIFSLFISLAMVTFHLVL
ncbi:MAG TPA: hypothetical protein DD405_03860 [Desulfobacteraceae bacterium]|nr:hypothetical protein [Desulfobacteraceae bacterium]